MARKSHRTRRRLRTRTERKKPRQSSAEQSTGVTIADPLGAATTPVAEFAAQPAPARAENAGLPRIFLLSPANAGGIRARLILREDAIFPLALRLREGLLTLGEAFSFISGLYFRGKLAYATAFAEPPPNTEGTLVITACGGLVSPGTLLTRDALCALSSAPVAVSEARYRIPLECDARILVEQMGSRCEVVLLGSIATPKYVEPLLNIFGERLLFPADFAGRGDMSRGGLMLRCARSGEQLTYVPVATAKRHGARPPKLPPIANSRAAWPSL